jgi:hypothetical protein
LVPYIKKLLSQEIGGMFLKELIGFAIVLAIRRAFFDDHIFGITSPSNKIKKVIPITSIKNRNVPFSSEIGSILFKNVLVNMTIAIFTKLFVISKVANNSLGFSKRFKTNLADLLFCCFKASFSAGPIEKNAASEPDANAEIIRSNKSRNILNME